MGHTGGVPLFRRNSAPVTEPASSPEGAPEDALAAPAPVVRPPVVDPDRHLPALDRQKADVEAMRRDEGIAIPDWLDYADISGLSNELRQKLTMHRPATLAQAQAIEGMTPAAATLLLAIVRRGALRKAG